MSINMIDDGSGCSSMSYSDLQSWTLSMSPGSHSRCATASRQISPTGTTIVEYKKRGSTKVTPKPPVNRKSIDTFGHRTSQYRGVTRGIGGQVDMKLIYGTTVARKKGRLEKEDKFIWEVMIWKRKLQELTIVRCLSTGDLQHKSTFCWTTFNKT